MPLAKARRPKHALAGLEPADLTTADISELFNVPARYITPAIRAGKLPPPDLCLSNKLRRWRRSTIERWLRDQKARQS